MEAAQFGFAVADPAFKFDPTDADIVAHYLLPRAIGLPRDAIPHAHAVIDDDPYSVPPWELMIRNGHEGSDYAFFLCPPRDPTIRNGGRVSRAVRAGGTWQGDKGSEAVLTLLRGGGGEADIRYKRYNLNYSAAAGKEGRSTGFVMHEYVITSPPLRETALCCVATTVRGKELMAEILRQRADAVSGYGEGFSGTQADGFHGNNNGGIGETGGYYYPDSLHYDGNANGMAGQTGEGGSDGCMPEPDHNIAGADQEYAAEMGGGEGFSGAQAGFHGDNDGGMGGYDGDHVNGVGQTGDNILFNSSGDDFMFMPETDDNILFNSSDDDFTFMSETDNTYGQDPAGNDFTFMTENNYSQDPASDQA